MTDDIGWERLFAYTWLDEDPDHRTLDCPTQLDAILNRYACERIYPGVVFTALQFSFPGSPSVGREVRVLGVRLWTSR